MTTLAPATPTRGWRTCSSITRWTPHVPNRRPSARNSFCYGGKRLVKAAMTQLQLSARAYYRILKLARTMPEPCGAQGDLAGSEGIQPPHLAETVQYRP